MLQLPHNGHPVSPMDVLVFASLNIKSKPKEEQDSEQVEDEQVAEDGLGSATDICRWPGVQPVQPSTRWIRCKQ